MSITKPHTVRKEAPLLCVLLSVLALLSLTILSSTLRQNDALATEAQNTETLEPLLSSVTLTDEEKDYLERNPRVSIAMDTSWVPYAFKDPVTGEVKGILVNLLDAISDSVGLQVDYVAKDSYGEALKTVQSGRTDLVSGIADEQTMADKTGLNRTKPYIGISYCAVSNQNIPDLFSTGAHHRVAVCVGSYATMAMRERMPDYEFIEYSSNAECMDAAKSGEVDMALIASYAADYYGKEIAYADLNSILINDFTWKLCFGANEEVDPLLIGILNKGIDSLTYNRTNQAVYLGMMDATSGDHILSSWVGQHRSAVFGGAVALIGAIFLLIVLSQRRKNRILHQQRDTDELTGLLNRFAFEREVQHYIETSNQSAFFIIIDLDDFKPINDEYGHAVGDEVLHAVAEKMRESFRENDYLARLGGDEFVVFVPTWSSQAMAAEGINAFLEQVTTITMPDHDRLSVSASAGFARYPSDGATFIELYRNADLALYRAKRTAKGTSIYY